MGGQAFFGRDTFLRDNGIVVATDELMALNQKRLYSTDQTNDAVASSGGTLINQGKTPADVRIQLISFGIYTTVSQLRIEFIEAPTVTNGTTVVSPVCRNRIYPRPSDMTCYSDPSGISNGTSLINKLSGTGRRRDNMEANINAGWILRPNTDYIIRLTNESNSEGVVSLALLWTEKPLRSNV